MTKKRKQARFTADDGHQYRVKVTFPVLRWIRDEIDVDLGLPQAFIALSNNPIDCVNVLYMLCKEQADQYEVSDVEFGESLTAGSLEDAWTAFGEAYLSFCPSHQATVLRRLMAAAEQAELVGVAEVETRLQRLAESYNLDSKRQPSQESTQTSTASEN